MDHMIAGQIANIRQSLPREQRILLNRLLDDINSADSEVFEKVFFLDLFLQHKKWRSHFDDFLHFFMLGRKMMGELYSEEFIHANSLWKWAYSEEDFNRILLKFNARMSLYEKRENEQ